MSEPFGFLVVDKPQGMTSHDVVAKVRRGIGIKRIGHAGTLDPMATGVLILCIGAATRLSEYVMDSTKVYQATLRLGVETDTYDAEGEVIATKDASQITKSDIESALKHFQGEVEQIPPMYSAIKQAGKKLYELARQGKEVDRAPRRVWMQTKLISVDLPDVEIEVTCSAGTYIRSIAHDLGALLGIGGHLTALRRLQSGSAESPVDWDVFSQAMREGMWATYLIDERALLGHIPEVKLSQEQTDYILHGRVITLESSGTVEICRTYDPDNQFVAILEVQDGIGKPIKVFHYGES